MKSFRHGLVLSIILLLCLLLSGAALAQGGNAVLFHDNAAADGGYSTSYISTMLTVGSRIYAFMYGADSHLLAYDTQDESAEPQDLGEVFSYSYDESDPGIREEVTAYFTWQDQIYAILTRYESQEEDEEPMPPEGGFIRRMNLEAGTTELLECDLPRLDWEPMIEGEGSWYGIRQIRSSFCLGDTLVFLVYDDSYSDLLLFYDLKTGRCEEQYMQNISSIAPGPDGKILLCRFLWEEADGTCEISLFDPASGSSEILSKLPAASGNVMALCFREDNNTLYYVAGGELRAVPDLDFAAAVTVNDCPLTSNPIAAVIPDGRILLYDYTTALLRTTDPEARQEIALRVTDYAYLPVMDTAYYDFIASNGNASVIIDRYGSDRDILQAMMNQDSSSDIYTLSMSSAAFNALYNRGYMASLSGSEKLTALVDSMYPAAASAVRKDGDLVALPLSASAYGLGYNPKVLAKAGLTEEDMPRSWEAFFDFLDQVPARLEGTGINVFPYWHTLSDIKSFLTTQILSDYESYAASKGQPVDFTAPVLLNLMDRVGQLEAEPLGLQTDLEEENGISYEWQEDVILLDLNTPLTVAAYNSEFTALMLSLDEGEPISGYQMYCAFVNPYSLHPREAASFLEAAAARLSRPDLYTLSPANNEPVRYPDYEEYKEYLHQSLAECREALEKEEDPTVRSDLEENIASLEENLASIDDTYWMISPGAISAYQARAPFLVPASWGMMGMARETYDEAIWSLFNNFAQGNASGRELLEQLNKKYQMMLQEGN